MSVRSRLRLSVRSRVSGAPASVRGLAPTRVRHLAPTSVRKLAPTRMRVVALALLVPALAHAQAADVPIARTDRNSQIAHQQLVEKAHRGGIDIYFEGDSIVRRWGATDYPDLLANWNQNFHG